MSSPSYFDHISEVMELEPPKAILAQSLHNSMIHFSRMTSLRDDHGMLPTPVEDAYLLTVERWDLPEVNIWLDGRHYSKHPMKAGRCSFVDLNVPTILEMNIKFDSECDCERTGHSRDRRPQFAGAHGLNRRRSHS
jgi:hypothetical protein